MSRLLADGQLREEDVGAVGFWLEMLRSYRYAPADTKGTLIFRRAIRELGYGKVISLAEQLNINPGHRRIRPESGR